MKAAILVSLLFSTQFGFAQAVYSPGAIVTRQGVLFNGPGVIDSYDSTDDVKSRYHRYDPATFRGDNADIICTGLITNSGLQEIQIYGQIHATGTVGVVVGPSVTVGSHEWQGSNDVGIEPGWVVPDANITFPDTSLPDTAGYFSPTGPYTNIVVSLAGSTNSPVYFEPSPWETMRTNITWTTNDSYPGPIDGLITNPGTAITVVCPNYPASGTYVGPVTTNSQLVTNAPLPTGCYAIKPAPVLVSPGKYNYYLVNYTYYPILNYAFPTATYTYWEWAYTTNVYDYVLSGYTHYVCANLSGKAVYVHGTNTIVVPNGLNGTEKFGLDDGASLRVCSGGTAAALNGTNIIGNITPASFVVSCAPSVTSLSVSGAFTGEIVAPNADATLQGGDFSGVIMANGVSLIGSMGFHFDESLTSVNYAVSGSTAYVTYSDYASGNVLLASSYKGYPVTSITGFAFYGNTNITGITIPDSVTNIESAAFGDCANLANVTFGSNVITIGDSAFSDCSKLTSVTIPDSVTNIGGAAFLNCTNLANVTFGSSVITIGDDAFTHCRKLTSVTIPDSVKSVGASAFADCPGLQVATLGGGVTNIGFAAFYGCQSLTNITFKGNAPVGGDSMFQGVPQSAKGYYEFGTTGWGPTYYGLPTVMLGAPPAQIPPGNIGVTPGGFGFTVNGVANQTIVIEASTNLVDWQPVWTNTLSETSADFVDPESTNFHSRFYRARSN